MDRLLESLPLIGGWLSDSKATIALLALVLAILALTRTFFPRRVSVPIPMPGRERSSSEVTARMAVREAFDGRIDRTERLENRFELLQDRLQLLERSGSGAPSPPGERYRMDLSVVEEERKVAQVVERPKGIPVELHEGWIVPSQSLSAPGTLMEDSIGRARVFINEEMDLSNLIVKSWASVFDMGSAEPFRRYRTVRPAEVEWNASAKRGRMVAKGQLEVV